MSAHESLGPQFSVENDVLHVQGKPFRMAQLLWKHEEGKGEHFGRLHVFRIPFESGHHLEITGGFMPGTGEISPKTNLVLHAYHDPTGSRRMDSPTRTDYEFEEPIPQGRYDYAVDPKTLRLMIGTNSAEEFHRRVREVGRLQGGSGGSG